jgi:uncharacterized protein (DUF2252 family)
LRAWSPIKKCTVLPGSREDNAEVKLVDAAYWMKGCSSLGRGRYAVLLNVDSKKSARIIA